MVIFIYISYKIIILFLKIHQNITVSEFINGTNSLNNLNTLKKRCNSVSNKNNNLFSNKLKDNQDIQSVNSNDFSVRSYISTDKRKAFSQKSKYIESSTNSFNKKKMQKHLTHDELDAIRQRKELSFRPKIIEIKYVFDLFFNNI